MAVEDSKLYVFAFLVAIFGALITQSTQIKCATFSPGDICNDLASLTNELRIMKGLHPLLHSNKLDQDTNNFTLSMIKYNILSHDLPNLSFIDRVQKSHFSAQSGVFCENICQMNIPSAREAFEAFTSSPKHLQNLLGHLTHMGCHVAYGHGKYWLTVLYALSDSTETDIPYQSHLQNHSLSSSISGSSNSSSVPSFPHFLNNLTDILIASIHENPTMEIFPRCSLPQTSISSVSKMPTISVAVTQSFTITMTVSPTTNNVAAVVQKIIRKYTPTMITLNPKCDLQKNLLAQPAYPILLSSAIGDYAVQSIITPLSSRLSELRSISINPSRVYSSFSFEEEEYPFGTKLIPLESYIPSSPRPFRQDGLMISMVA